MTKKDRITKIKAPNQVNFNVTEVIGIIPDFVPDEDFIPGPLPLISEGFLKKQFSLKIQHFNAGAMSFFTLIYVTPILGLIYYLFFWSRSTRPGVSCVSKKMIELDIELDALISQNSVRQDLRESEGKDAMILNVYFVAGVTNAKV